MEFEFESGILRVVLLDERRETEDATVSPLVALVSYLLSLSPLLSLLSFVSFIFNWRIVELANELLNWELKISE